MKANKFSPILLFFFLMPLGLFSQEFIKKSSSIVGSERSNLIQQGTKNMIFVPSPSSTSWPTYTSRVTIDANDLTTYPALKVLTGHAVGIETNGGLKGSFIETEGGVYGFFAGIGGTSSLGWSIFTAGPINIGENATKASEFYSPVNFNAFVNLNNSVKIKNELLLGEIQNPATIKSKTTDFISFTALEYKGNNTYIDKPIFKYNSALLDVIEPIKINSTLQITTNAGKNKVLLSDENGFATWSDVLEIIKGDNLGNHIATQNLNISSFDILGVKNITANNYYGQKVFTGQILGFSQGDDWGKLEIFGSSNSDAAKIEVGNGVDDNALKFITKRDGAIQFSISNTWVADITANNFVIGNPYTPETTVDLKVYGKIYGREVKVTLDKWYDHVFALDYKLMPLEELSVFVKQNNHLPDMPTESEVLKNGVNVGEMNALLLKKVEELTLYVIEQQKQNIEQQKQIDELKATLGK